MPPWMPPNIPAAGELSIQSCLLSLSSLVTHHYVGGAPPAWAGAAATMQLPAPVSSFENLLTRELFS